LSVLATRPVSELLGTNGAPDGAVLVMLGEVFREVLEQRIDQFAPLSRNATNAASA
jgi:uroporphyrin-III C-methyltransferase